MRLAMMRSTVMRSARNRHLLRPSCAFCLLLAGILLPLLFSPSVSGQSISSGAAPLAPSRTNTSGSTSPSTSGSPRKSSNPSTNIIDPNAANSKVPQVVPTPPTQPLGPGSPSGDPAFDAASASVIPAPPDPPSAWTRSTHTIAPCTVAPQIDGRLDDACWKTATHVRGFYRYGGGGKPSAQQTEIWICADRTHLYVAFHCLDSQPGLIRSSMTQRNGNIGRDDFVGFDIDSQGTRHGFSTFISNARGTQLELLEGGTADNITWAGDWKAVTQRTRNGWNCEMAIPFALLRYPRGATSFGMVFYRLIGRETSLQSWPYMPAAGGGQCDRAAISGHIHRHRTAVLCAEADLPPVHIGHRRHRQLGADRA